MENKKELIKTSIVVIIVIGIIIYNFVFKDRDEFDYNDITYNSVENIENNTNSNEIKEISKIKVYVVGEVKFPGVVELEEGSRIEDAIILAGGTTDKSDLSKINLAYSLEDGQKLYVPSIKENFENQYVTTDNEDGVLETTNSEKDAIININTADVSELCGLPGVGEGLAERIVTYRKENGKFKTIEDLKNVSGIGDKKFESIKDLIKAK